MMLLEKNLLLYLSHYYLQLSPNLLLYLALYYLQLSPNLLLSLSLSSPIEHIFLLWYRNFEEYECTVWFLYRYTGYCTSTSSQTMGTYQQILIHRYLPSDVVQLYSKNIKNIPVKFQLKGYCH